LNTKNFILYRRKLSTLYSLMLELPPSLRGKAEEIIEKWKKQEISYEQALNQILLLGEGGEE